jgi:anthranilate synthase component 1
MKPPFDIAADLDTPVSAFLKLRPSGLDAVFLLESVEGGERMARYSFIGLGRARRVRLDERGLSVDDRVVVAPELADRERLTGAIRDALAGCPRLEPTIPGLGMDGGLVGFIGYDYVRRLERVGVGPAPRSGEAELDLVAPKSMLVFDHLTRRVALLHAGPEWERQSIRRELVQALRGPQPSAQVRTGHEPSTGSLSEREFVDRVERVKRHIIDGDVFQLVLSVRFSGACRTDPFEVYRGLRLLNPSPYMYYFDFGDTQVAGSSPEALVKLANVAGNRIATLRPIAGTRPRGRDAEHDRQLEEELLADPKESAEHVMLVDLARNDLGRVAVPGSVKVEPYRSIERYSHVMHIVSGVSGVLEDRVDALDLFNATFPAGTVVGAPKVRAMQIIDQLEPVRRGLYAGTVGYFALSGAMDQAIAIRTLVFRDGAYAYQAGAGIVADSDAHAEYAEVRAKVSSAEAALRLAEEGL